MSVVVTGATGHLGRLVVQELLARGVAGPHIVATGRDIGKLKGLAEYGVEAKHADFAELSTLTAAFAGADKLLLISTSTVGERVGNHRRAIDAARAAGVSLIVYTSLVNADTAEMLLADEHLQTELYLRDGGVPFVILRNGWYLENYTDQLSMFRQYGTVVGSARSGSVSAASRTDYAAAAAAVLTQDGHAGNTYELGGDRAFTLAELAATVSGITGHTITYTDLPVDQFASVLRDAGLPSGLAAVLADADAGLARGELYTASTQLRELVGRPTTTLAQAVQVALS